MFRLPKSHILRGRIVFSEVYSFGTRQSCGALLLIGLPNTLPHDRLGISVPKRVGNAVRRNRVKRQLREAYRLMPRQSPAHYDWLVIVRPHAPMKMIEYQSLLMRLMREIGKNYPGT